MEDKKALFVHRTGMTSSVLLESGRRSGRKRRCNPTQGNGKVQGTDGGVLPLFQVQRPGCGSVWLVERLPKNASGLRRTGPARSERGCNG